MSDRPTRRGFVGALATLAGASLVPGSLAFAESVAASGAQGPWDLSWLDGLKGKHKQVFAVGTLADHAPMHVVTNWLDAHHEVFGLADRDLTAIVGISVSLPVNAVDALWAKYELGRRWQVKDPVTNEWATRNVYLEHMPAGGKEVGVRRLQQRGAIFWQCNNALNAIARSLAHDTQQTFEAVRAELLAGLNPGVKLIPAHTMLLGLVQERGCAYEQIG